jgi:glycoprotein endo-alpha-1,2-mannosidase
LFILILADGFTEASTMTQWPKMSQLCSQNLLLFIPSIGPGYDDTRVRPWNAQNIRARGNGGTYYKQHFEMAHAAKADLVSITSFNEWHEGTQIEAAIPYRDDNGTLFVYEQYERPEQYLEITHEMIQKYFVPHHENIPANIAKIV